MHRRSRVLGLLFSVCAVLALALPSAGAGDVPPPDGSETTDAPPTESPPADPPSDPVPEAPAPDGEPSPPDAAPTDPPPDEPPPPPEPEGETAAFGALDFSVLAAPDADTLTVRKDAIGGDGTFPITLQTRNPFLGGCPGTGWSNVTSTNLTDGGSTTFDSLINNKCYRVVEGPLPTGWVFGDVIATSSGSCTVTTAADGFRFLHTTGATRDCTIRNVMPSITVAKQTGAGDPSESFTIHVEYCTSWFFVCLDFDDVTGSPVTLSDGQSSSPFTNLPTAAAGLYQVREEIPSGWRLDDVSGCSGTPNALVQPDGLILTFSVATPSHSCTFENVNQRVTITKQTKVDGNDVAAPREFDVVLEKCPANFFHLCLSGSGSWTQVGSTATLSDDEAASFTSLEADLFDRLYRIREDVPAGWTATFSCAGGTEQLIPITDGIMILFPLNALNVAAFADCTVTNETTSSSITVQKATDPAGGEGFGFSFADLDDPAAPAPTAFTLDDGGSQVFSGLVPSGPNGYELAETSLPATWSLAEIDCGSGPLTITGDAVTISLGAGETLTCTALNTSSATNGISLTKTASPTTAIVGDTITYTYTVTNTGPGGVTGVSVVDTPLGPVANLTPTTLGPGDSATGTLTRPVTAADAGTTIVNTALATGTVTCTSFCATATVTVTASATASVAVAEVGGISVTNPNACDPGSADCDLPFTGASISPWLASAGGAIVLGLALIALTYRRRRIRLEG